MIQRSSPTFSSQKRRAKRIAQSGTAQSGIGVHRTSSDFLFGRNPIRLLGNNSIEPPRASIRRKDPYLLENKHLRITILNIGVYLALLISSLQTSTTVAQAAPASTIITTSSTLIHSHNSHNASRNRTQGRSCPHYWSGTGLIASSYPANTLHRRNSWHGPVYGS